MSASCTRDEQPAEFRDGAAAVAQGVPGRLAKVLGRFRRDQSGVVAQIFGIMLIPLTAMIGLAVDFGRVYAVNSSTQVALDAAALAAGRVAQVETSDIVNKASAAATSYFDQTKPKNIVSSTLQFSPNSAQTAFTVTATSWVKTPFLGSLDFIIRKASESGAPSDCQGSYFKCMRLTTTSTAELKAGGDGGSNVEVAMMLDVTGSMCTPCDKIDALKPAAKDLVDIAIWSDQSQYTARIALAPFAEAVNVGTTLAPLVRGTVTTGTQTLTNADMTNTSVQPNKQSLKFPNVSNSTTTWTLSSKCVTERIGNDKYTDAKPVGTSTYVGKGYFGTNATTSCGVGNFSDTEVNSVYPLTDDKDVLKRRIDKLTTAGSTAGHLGTAWAWYLLSPNWNSIFSQAFSTAKAAGPYSDLTTLNAKGAPKLRKIAVLMTDGDYNINYCKGVEAKNSDQSPDINCNSENGKSLAQATSLCSALKSPLGSSNAAKIEVFTVGFQVSSSAKTFLQSCATDNDHYYDATTGDALKAAFRDIALKISTLRLTN
jgi:Flp pilus assembly protein TadG